MSTDCEQCGFKSNEIQSGNAIREQGCRISLCIKEAADLARDVLKTDTCKVIIPDLDIEIGGSIISGRFTTVEGLLSSIKDHLSEHAPFFVGDSSTESHRKTFESLLATLEQILRLEHPCTLVLDDPTGNSYVQSLMAPLDDSRLTKEFYERSYEQNEDLGLNDMKVEDYSPAEKKMKTIEEEDNET